MKITIRFIIAFALIGAAPFSFATDWPRYLGPNGNGIVEHDVVLSLDWEEAPPEITWTRQVGFGCSSFSIANGRAFTLGNLDGRDTIWCFDASNGDVIWKHSYEEALATQGYLGGPTSTPTIDANRVYTVSVTGKLFCLDFESGDILWKKDYPQDFQGRKGHWGWTASPLVYGDLLLIDAGGEVGALVALDKSNGDFKWAIGDDEHGYSTPVIYNHNGKEAVAVFNKKALVGYDLESLGSTLFRFPWRTGYGVNATNPQYRNGKFFISSGYGYGYAVIDIEGDEPTILHRDRERQLKMQTNLLIDNRIIAHFGGDMQPDDLIAMDFDSGETLWRTQLPGDLGNVIAVGEYLIVYTDSGHVVLGKDAGRNFQELGRKHVLSGTSWALPAYANTHLFLRNNKGEAVCLDVSRK